MEVLVVKKRLVVDAPILENLQRALLNINRFDEHWLAEQQWQVAHSEDSNFVDEDAFNFVEFCKSHGVEELIAAETLAIFSSTGVLNARSFPCSVTALSQALYGLAYPFNKTHEDAAWLLDAALGVNLIFGLKQPWEFLVLRDSGDVVSIAGTELFIQHMTALSTLSWFPGQPSWVRQQF